MKLSEIREGFCYSKKSDPDWLRYVLNIDKRVVLYVEWLGYRVCRVETIANFAAERLTLLEAAKRHPEEFAKIAKILEQNPGYAVGMFDAVSWNPDDDKDKIACKIREVQKLIKKD